MNLTAVKLFGLPAPHQMGLGLKQFIATRYHRVIDAWSGREAGDARAAHPDPLTLSLSAKRKNGSEVRVMMTRRMLCEGREGASWLVTVREVTLVHVHSSTIPSECATFAAPPPSIGCRSRET
jgi:hypothetical protein